MRLVWPDRRAAALVFSLGILAVLGVLGVSFVRMSAIERTASRHHYHHVGARFLALAGVERAQGELQRLALDGRLDAVPHQGWVYVPDDLAGPLADSMTPSLPFDANGNGVFENGRDGTTTDDLVYGRAVSGVIEGSRLVKGANFNEGYERWGRTYKLRITDNSGLLNINSPQPNLATLLENLGAALAPTHLLNPVPAGEGVRIVAHRDSLPGKRFTRMSELAGVLGEREYEVLRYYVTLDGWMDPDTIRPKPLRERRRPLSLGDSVYAMDELNPVSLDAEPRAPINVNVAPRPVVAAVLLGIKGFYLEEKLVPSALSDEAVFEKHRTARISYTTGVAGRLGVLRESRPVDFATAAKLAEVIAAYRDKAKFTHWGQFAEFLSEQVTAGIIDLFQRDAILANCNPNTNLNETNPSPLLWKRIDKSDLAAYTTELSFTSTGHFSIESLGRVTHNQGQSYSLHTIRTDVSMFDLRRETTQAQFLAGYLKNGTLDGVITPSSDGETSTGRSLQSYPEPLAVPMVRQATYDGHLTLATIRRGYRPGNQFYASLYGTLAGTTGGGAVANVPDRDGPYERAFLPGSPALHPGDLRPDGVYVERDSSLAYPARTVWSQRRGGISFWVKPNWDPAQATRPHPLLSATRLSRLASGTILPELWGVWYFPPETGAATDFGPYPWFPRFPSARALTFGNWIDASDALAGKHTPPFLKTGIASNTLNHDGHGDGKPNLLAARKWVHVAIGWDWDHPRPAERVMMFVNGARVPAANAFHDGALAATAHKEHLDATDLTVHHDGTANLLRLGELASAGAFNHAADATYGELRTYKTPAGDLASDYRAGRYYPSDGTFFSLPRHYGESRTISHVAWTAYHPDSRSRAIVKVYDTNGTDSLSDDKLIGQGSSSANRLEVGKTVKGSRYEVILEPNGGRQGPCWETVTLKIAYPKPSTGTLIRIKVTVPAEAAPHALSTESNSEGWTATGIGVDPATGMGGWIYSPPAPSGGGSSDKGNNGLGNGTDPAPNDKNTNQNDTPERVAEKGFDDRTGKSRGGSGGGGTTTTPEYLIVRFKVPCHLVNRIGIGTTVQAPAGQPAPKGNNGLGNGVDPAPNDRNQNFNDSPERVAEKGFEDRTGKSRGTGGTGGAGGTSERDVVHDYASRSGQTDGNGYTSNIVEVVETHGPPGAAGSPEPILESPVFDDITVFSFKGFTVLRWEEE